MSLGTGALKVGQEPDHLRNSRRYPWQCCTQEPPLHAATNWHCHTEGIQWKILTWPHTYQRTNPKRGGKGWEPESAEIHFNSRSSKISMKCNTSHKISKGPCGHPKDHIRLSRRPQTASAWNLTLAKCTLHCICIKNITFLEPEEVGKKPLEGGLLLGMAPCLCGWL